MITLLTDFGLQDPYVGIMKGAIACISPQIKTIDLTHQIPPQNILAGRFALMNAFSYFPEKTVHLGVIDPGVGSNRKGVAIQVKNCFLVGPDNGLFSGILSKYEATFAVELSNCQYWLNQNPSNTFHGRDVFAPVAAHLANGVSIEKIGNQIDVKGLKKIEICNYICEQNQIIGFIQYIDVFGNLITNVPADILKNKLWEIVVNNQVIPSGKTYSDVAQGNLVSLIGSHGWLEIAVNGGNARIQLQKNWGDQIVIKL